MRLTCPNCSAQYDVPDEVIPTDGRDVQCSSCNETWFQSGSAIPALSDQDLRTYAQDDEDTRVDTPPVRRRELDPGIRDLLREEVEREARLRARETAHAKRAAPRPAMPPTMSNESDLDRREAESRARAARLGTAGMPRAAAQESPARSRRDLLPDIEETSATLHHPQPQNGGDPAPRAETTRRNFRIGFALPILAALLVAFVYFNADRIRMSLPQTTPMIDGFTTTIDQGRLWLDSRMQALRDLFSA